MDPVRREQITASFNRSKMMQLFSGSMAQLDKGFCTVSIPKKDFMARPAGMFNGSIIASVVDVASGYAAASAQDTDGYFTTVELKINYLNPAFGDYLLAKATVIKNGKVLVVLRTDVFALKGEEEKLVATSLVTMMKLKGT